MAKAKQKTTRLTTKATPEFKPTPLSLAYAEWMKARARIAEINTLPESPHSTRAMLSAINAEREAEWRIIGSPSENFVDLKMRAELVGVMFQQAAESGKPTDGRHYVALDVLLAEIANPPAEA